MFKTRCDAKVVRVTRKAGVVVGVMYSVYRRSWLDRMLGRKGQYVGTFNGRNSAA